MITQNELKTYVHYDSEKGILTRIKCTAKCHKLNEVIRSKDVYINNIRYSRLKLIWLYYYGIYPKTNVIRLDQNTSNDKISNLATTDTIKSLTLSLSNLKKFLNYDKDTGKFTWKLATNSSITIGSEAGHIQGDLPDGGYIKISLFGKIYNAHHLAWMYEYGNLPSKEIDHINQIRTDNRIINLREVSNKENMKNKSLYKNNSSGICGVYKKVINGLLQ